MIPILVKVSQKWFISSSYEWNLHSACSKALIYAHTLGYSRCVDQNIRVINIKLPSPVQRGHNCTRSAIAVAWACKFLLLSTFACLCTCNTHVCCSFFWLLITLAPCSVSLVKLVIRQVHSLEDREQALKHDRGYIGKRYVTVRVVTERAMNDFISRNSTVVSLHEGADSYWRIFHDVFTIVFIVSSFFSVKFKGSVLFYM